MKLYIIQLSDIHLEDSSNPVSNKVDKIVSAVTSRITEIEGSKVVLLYTGDIAYSGSEKQYEVAQLILEEIQGGIEDFMGDKSCITSLVLPGNHDCDFKDLQTNYHRDLVMKDIQAKYKEYCSNKNIQSFKLEKIQLESVATAQHNFFKFATKIMDPTREVNGELFHNGLQYVYEMNTSGKRIVFQLLNTALLSTLKEKQGELIVPVSNLKDINYTGVDIAVTAFHHPLNWIENVNRKELEEYLGKCSDVVITGHEHVSEYYTKDTYNFNNTCLAGGVLQVDCRSDESYFNILVIDLENYLEKLVQFAWEKNIYRPIQECEWRPLVRNKYANALIYKNTQEFEEWLNDVGASFSHPKKDKLVLSDVYVVPDFRIENDADEDRNSKSEILEGKDAVDYINKRDKILIQGTEDIGKTSFAKVLYKEKLQKGFIPIYIDGRTINSGDGNILDKFVRENFVQQYGEGKLEEYLQMEKDKKIIFLDNFHQLPLGGESKRRLLQYVSIHFKQIILLADDNVYLSILYKEMDVKKIIDQYDALKVLTVGRAMREELIKKWKSIGLEINDMNEDQKISFDKVCVETSKNLEVLIGKNVFPRIPITVLMLLQQLEINTNSKNYSKYAQLYEYLIWQQFNDASITEDYIDMYRIIFGILAYKVFKKNSNGIGLVNKEDIRNAIESYQQFYGSGDNERAIIEIAIKCSVLIKDGERYQFKYDYIYYYFVSLYLKEFLNKVDDDNPEVVELAVEARNQITDMCSMAYHETYANILLFLCHLSGKDNFILNQLLQEARKIFNHNQPYTLEKHYKFIEELSNKIKEKAEVIEIGKAVAAASNRRKMLEERDKQEREQEEYKHEQFEDAREMSATEHSMMDEQGVQDILDLNKALKMIELLGQVAKNYFGSLMLKPKEDLVGECYNIGLRLLDNFMIMMNNNIDDLVELFSEYIMEEHKVKNLEDVKSECTKFLFNLTKMITTSVIIRVVRSVDHKKLEDVYEKLLQKNDNMAYKLIDLGLKFETSTQIPKHTMYELNEELESSQNIYSKSVFMRIVKNYLYTYQYAIKDIQEVSDRLGKNNVNEKMALITRGRHKEYTTNQNQGGKMTDRR